MTYTKSKPIPLAYKPSKLDVKSAMLHNIKHAKQNGGHQRSSVERVSTDIDAYRNGSTVIVGRQGGGKTFDAVAEAIAISHILPTVHCIVYIGKKAFDTTIESARELSNVPIVDLMDETAENELHQLFDLKNIYNRIKRTALEQGTSVEEFISQADDAEDVVEFMERLHITDFERPWLDTLVIYDDCGNSKLFKNPDSRLNNWLKLLRDINATFWLGIHSFSQLPPSVRQNVAIIKLCRGLSRERLSIIHHQSNSGVDYKDFVKHYEMMSKNPDRRYLVLDCLNSTLKVE